MTRTADKRINWYLTSFDSFEKSIDGESTSHIHAIRKAAIERFIKLGFPSSSDEEWRFTNISPLSLIQFTPVFPRGGRSALTDRMGNCFIKRMDGQKLVFINGHYSKELSSAGKLQGGVKILSLAEALKSDTALVTNYLTRYASYEADAFTALNTGFMQDGAFVYIPDGVVLDEPIYIVYISAPEGVSRVSHPRNLIVAGKGSRVRILEHYTSGEEGMYFTNEVSEIVAGDGAFIDHTKLQSESMKAFHIASKHAHLGAGSSFTSNSISVGGLLVRNNVNAVLAAEGAECTLNGLALATGQQHVDNHTAIDHAKPNCASHELYKSILDGKSRGVFNGKIYVRKDAQKTDAKQTNKTLLLSDGATMNTKPQLEIFADDVKCTHGATIGYLDAEAIFYLRTRGIGEELARDILTYAFAGDVTNRIGIESVRDHLKGVLRETLQKGRQIGDF